MSDKRAILADFTDFKRVPTRNAFQIIFEVPLEQAEEAINLLGNPLPGKELKCGIARVAQRKERDVPNVEAAGSTPPASTKKERRPFESLPPSQQAALRCNDRHFQDFLWSTGCTTMVGAATHVRDLCGVRSRAELDHEPEAAEAWKKLNRDFEEWLGTQRAQQQYDQLART